MVTELNRPPPPEGCAQKFSFLYRSGFLIAARATLTHAIDERLMATWPGWGNMLVASVRMKRAIAGFQ
eukprot:2274818-Lingulodinium_polyedra.AAC.1